LKSLFYTISLSLFFFLSFAQKQTRFVVIDSLQKNILNAKGQDSLSIANANFSIAEVYRYNLIADSSYYYYQKAEQYYEKLGKKLQLARSLYGIAVIQKNQKVLTGSELTSIRAITILESLEQTNDVKKYTSYVYNNLGLVFGQLRQYEECISYLSKALDLKENLEGENKNLIYGTKNNLALYYKTFGKYDLALLTNQEILKDKNLLKTRPSFYAIVLNNYAHNLFLLRDYQELPKLYFDALKIMDSLNPEGHSVSEIYQNLGEYYNFRNNKSLAKYYALQAKETLERHENNTDILRILLLLSEIEDGEESVNYLRDYVTLSDSLHKAQRAIRNKFARIRFETKKIQEENIQIAKERTWLLIVSIVVILASILLYLTISQRIKNNELQFIQKQQEANEEIYNLMLSQNKSIEEARFQEKKRISQELHDGVLGRLFGTRLSLDSLNMNNSNEAVATRGEYINGLKTIEDEIRKVSHELNTDFVSGSGFLEIIETLVETQTQAYKIKYTLEHNSSISWDSISNNNKIHIYRIIQETMLNIHKHASATEINISFKLKNDVICLLIKDDGIGFEMDKDKTGIGLKNIKSRVKEINGTLSISSKKNNGTELKIEAPLA